jgi:formate/nitrite transporter FocA (FNT family)
VILSQGYNLYTGKVGYLIDNKPKYMIDIILMIVGNFIGIMFVALIVRLASIDIIIDNAQILVNYKLSYQWYQALGLAVLCGMVMYLAAEGYRRSENAFARVIIVLFAVVIFIIAGFEHSIADLFYFAVANIWSWQALIFIVLLIIGNGIGAITLNGLEKLAHLKGNVHPVSYHDEVKKPPKNKH